MSTFDETSGAPRGEQCQCPTCGLLFAGEQYFNRHRMGRYGFPAGHPSGRRCRTPEEMLKAKMEQNAAGHWRMARATRKRGSDVCTTASEATGTGPGARTTEHQRTPQNPSLHNRREAA
jgi:hypothetical protein